MNILEGLGHINITDIEKVTEQVQYMHILLYHSKISDVIKQMYQNQTGFVLFCFVFMS